MFRKIEDFTSAWKHESAFTLAAFETLTDASLSQRVSPDGREMGRLATHITETVSEMLHKTGLTFEGDDDLAQGELSANEIATKYKSCAAAAAEAVASQWTDASLTEEIDMYGMQWSKGVTLSILINHQAHHRGQLTVLMRQAGLQPPSIYGPRREDWAEMNMPELV